jgi:neutral amino acid transport system substrate-binding protein
MQSRNFGKRSIALSLVMLPIALNLASCQEAAEPGKPTATGGAPAGGATDAGLKLGSLLPATGDLSLLGGPMIASVPLLVKTVNSCGGVNGKPVTLKEIDDQTDPAAGTEGMTKLATVDKVAGVVGSFSSGVSSAAMTVALRSKVMLVSPGSTNPKFTERAAKGEFQGYWARTAPSDVFQAPALAKLAFDKGFKRVSVIAINNDYGVGFEKEFVKAFKALGGTVTTENNPIRYDAKATTLKTEAAAAFASKPDAVAALAYGETGSLLLKSAYEQGVSEGVPILLPDGMYADDLAKKVGQTKDGKFIAAGALGTIPGSNGKAFGDFSKIWQAELKRPVGAYAAHSWDATALLVLAAQAAKSNTGEGIKSKILEVANAPGEEVSDVCKALELLKEGKDINYQGASGNVDLDANGDIQGVYDVWTIKDDGTIGVTGQVK